MLFLIKKKERKLKEKKERFLITRKWNVRKHITLLIFDLTYIFEKRKKKIKKNKNKRKET